jgi:flagellar hook-associated protein 3 FlgL
MRIIYDLFRDGLAAINTASQQLNQAQRQVSTGKRVASAGDDPLAVQQAVGERAMLGAIDAYSRTNASAAARLATVDDVLSAMGDKLTAARVAGMSAQGTNLSVAARAAASAEVRSLRDSILADINTQFQGQYLFSGTTVNAAAYQRVAGSWTYQGNGSVAQVEVERGRLVSVTFNGQSILQGSDATDVLTSLDALATAMDAGNNTAIAAELAAVERAYGRTQTALGTLGASERGLDEAAARLASMRTSTEARRASLEDVNLAEAVTRMTQAETAYRAALGAVSTAERQSLLDYLR